MSLTSFSQNCDRMIELLKELKIEMRSFAKQIIIQEATQQKKKHRNEKTRQQYKRRTLQQANTEQIAENIAEKPTASCSISTVNKSLLPTTPHQAVKHSDRESASRHSSSNKVHGCNSFRLRFLVKPFHYTVLASLPGYMGYAKEMEATGQG